MAVSFTDEASLRGWDEMGIGAEFVDGGLDGAECLTQWMGRVVAVCGESSPAGAQDAQIDLGGEQGRLQAEGSEKVAVGTRHALNEALQAEPPQIVGHAVGGVDLLIQPYERGHSGTEVAIAESLGQVYEAERGLEQRVDPLVPEPERGDPLAIHYGGPLQVLEGGGREGAALGEPLHFQGACR